MCDEGFNLTGNNTRLCLANGSWGGTNSTCESELTDMHEIDGLVSGDVQVWAIEEYTSGDHHFSQ